MRVPASVVRIAETSHALAGGLHRHLKSVRRFRIRGNRVEQATAVSVALIRRENNHLHPSQRRRQAEIGPKREGDFLRESRMHALALPGSNSPVVCDRTHLRDSQGIGTLTPEGVCEAV